MEYGIRLTDQALAIYLMVFGLMLLGFVVGYFAGKSNR